MPTVAEDLAFSLRRTGAGKDDVRDRVSEMLDKFGLAGHADHPAHLLSGGQKQMLAIGAVLIRRPRGPRGGRADHAPRPAQRPQGGARLRHLDQQVVVVTHHLDLLTNFDRVIVIHDARVAYDGRPADALPAYEALLE